MRVRIKFRTLAIGPNFKYEPDTIHEMEQDDAAPFLVASSDHPAAAVLMKSTAPLSPVDIQPDKSGGTPDKPGQNPTESHEADPDDARTKAVLDAAAATVAKDAADKGETVTPVKPATGNKK